ncbi:MAG: dihydrolipoamide acetyltransferase family protein, partial [Steroidobacteraceae bacterium]
DREGVRTGRVLASPATRMHAREAGIDLATVVGTGRDGRIQRQDLESAISDHARPSTPGAPPARIEAPRQARTETEEIRILGVRRVSAQRVADSKRNIPHFAYVEEVDVTELERLRRHLNSKLPQGTAGYTYLPFLALALVRVIERLPKCNSLYDAERNVLVQHRGVHVGVATQTSDGLKVPVVRHVEALSLQQVAAEIRRVTEAARKGTATRNELRGSTITITSLGKLGGIVSTPIINAPEVAIIGVNKAIERPVVQNGAIAVRLMMNLSSSFDHRFIDGYDAAETIQALKELLEQPATIFIGSG